MFAKIAQTEVGKRHRVARADHVHLIRKPESNQTTVIVDGQPLELPDDARVDLGFRHDKARPIVTISIMARRVQITAKTLDVEGTDQ